MSDEFDHEPIPGLPGRLPAGETLLWQGAPKWQALAIRAFHARQVAIYCGLLLAWRVVADLSEGASLGATLQGLLWILPIAAAAVGLPTLLGWLYARSTIFSITNRRVVMRFGVAIPMAINLPFTRIASADLKTYRDGTGDVPLALAGSDKIAYVHLWPFARPWRLARPEPMLRAISDPEAAARTLAEALEKAHSEPTDEARVPRIKRHAMASAA